MSPGLLFQFPARMRVVEFGNMMTSGIAILVHAFIFFCILTILTIAIGIHASAEILGSGYFGSSYKANLVCGKGMVVKRFRQMNNLPREEFHEHIRRLGRLNHPNLHPISAYYYYRKEEKLLVSEFVSKASLASNIHCKHNEEKPSLNWETRLHIIKGVGKGKATDEEPDLPTWVSSMIDEGMMGEVFDKDMGWSENNMGEMVKLAFCR
ncbi:hypothetical protein QQ045_007694 [Rhodiola kirilowii]